MTKNEFRKLALSLPEATEASHMDHPDFRVGNKIFATLAYQHDDLGMVALVPEQQAHYVRNEPEIFEPVKGGWGRKGATHVHLPSANRKLVLPALQDAWRNKAPKKLLQKIDAEIEARDRRKK